MRARYKVLVAGSVATALLVIASCGEVAQNLDTGARCSLNSDCKTPLVCGFERCRAQCNTSRDCGGKLCVRSETNGQSANVCQLDDEVECTHNSQCPGSQLCGPDRHCRDVCITDKDCVTDLLCVSRVCAKPEELRNGSLPQRSPVDAGASCTYATDCPNDLVCLYGRCDVECLGPKDCLVGWTCRSQNAGGDGRCYPNGSSVAKDAGLDATADATGDADAGGLPPTPPNLIATGYQHSCAILGNNTLKCWGSNEDGRIGLGKAGTVGDEPGEMGLSLQSVDFGNGFKVASVYTSAMHGCAILDKGTVKCWGMNSLGQLGLGDKESRGLAFGTMGSALPFVDLGTSRTAKSLAVNETHTCAILDNDKVKCWGAGGVLGLGDLVGRGAQPNQMGDNLPYVDLGTGRTAKAITALENATCAILDNDKVKCWGANYSAHLGLGDENDRGDEPNEMGDNLPYVDLGTGRTAKAISSQDGSVCVILDNNRVKCWGYNADGQLGLGDLQDRGDGPNEMGDNLPYVDLGTGRTAKVIAVGEAHACAILDNDKVKCWGTNGSGELGLGNSSLRLGDGPNEMGDNLPYVDLGKAFPVAISATSGHSCVRLVTGDNKCWGANSSGQLGLGDKLDRGKLPNEMGDKLPIVKLN